MTDLAFTDIESTGLSPDRHDVWEIAVIRRKPDGTETEYLWQRRPTDLHLDLSADPKALEIGRYRQRMAVPRPGFAAVMPIGDGQPVPITLDELDKQVHAALDGAVMIGSNPAFDASFLWPMLEATPWHYRVVDVATLAAGYLFAAGQVGTPDPALPFSSRALSRAVGVEPPGDGVAHTALGDARWAARVWDAVTGRAEVTRLTALVGQYADRAIANGQRAEQAEAERDAALAAIARVRQIRDRAGPFDQGPTWRGLDEALARATDVTAKPAGEVQR